jgi:hypothetical protein
VLHGWERVVSASRLVVRGASILGVPGLVTEQYPRGLGHTAAELAGSSAGKWGVVEKMSMSCCGSTEFGRASRPRRGADQVLVVGIETHACVNQTVHDLIARGYQVHVARDATSSRRPADVAPAWDKMRAAGCCRRRARQALLELIRAADNAEFKTLQRLLKETVLRPNDGAGPPADKKKRKATTFLPTRSIRSRSVLVLDLLSVA